MSGVRGGNVTITGALIVGLGAAVGELLHALTAAIIAADNTQATARRDNFVKSNG